MKKLIFTLFALCFGLAVFAQTRQITGTVTSAADGSPIPGATVMVKGTTIGTVTNINGGYTLAVPEEAKTLAFSFVGMKTTEVPVSGTVVNAALNADIIGVDEVLVVAYGTSKRSSFTGSAQKVGSDELVGTSTSESLDKMLSGKVSGVRVSSTTGAPGASGEIQIRGIGSINASTTPLYVIDGVPLETGTYGYVGFSTDLALHAQSRGCGKYDYFERCCSGFIIWFKSSQRCGFDYY